MRIPLLVFSVLFTLSATAQPLEITATTCHMAEVPVSAELIERRLIGCGRGLAENVLWHLDRSDSVDGTLDGTFRRRTTGRGAVIYVMDSGVMRDHAEFQRAGGSNVIGGIFAGSAASCPGAELVPCYDPKFPLTAVLHGHGTGVAAVAAGAHGVAPGASIVSVMYTDAASLVRALHAIIRHAFDPATPPFRTAVINFSLSLRASEATPETDALIERMIGGVDIDGNADPNGKRFFFTAAAGNYADDRSNQCGGGKSVVLYPGLRGPSLEGLMTVGGLDRDNALWAGSCMGDALEILAPAAEVLAASIIENDTYRYKPDRLASGTSWSAPFVAGMAARLLEANPDLTPAELERALKASPSRVGTLPVAVLIETGPPAGKRRRAATH